MNQPTVLVTGATGFIGSHLVRALLEGVVANVVAASSSGSTRNLEAVRDRITVCRADVGSFTNVLRMIEAHRPSTIYHLGAMLAPACDADPEAGLHVNAMGTYYLLEASRLLGVEQVIFASSMSVLGGSPDFIYGAAKQLSENIGLFFRRRYAFDYRGLRLPNVIGPGTTTHGYLEYFNKAIEESASGRAYSIYVEPHVSIPIMYVEDAARAFMELARAPAGRIESVNYVVLGPTPAPTAQELADVIRAKIPGAKLDFDVDRDVSTLIESVAKAPYDDTPARREWGWQHRYDTSHIIGAFMA